MKRNLLSFLLLLLSPSLFAQDFPYAESKLEEVSLKKYAKDTSAHAVVLQEFGDSRLNVDVEDNVRLYFTYHVKIKILDNKGFGKANIEIPYYEGDNNSFERVTDIKGVTYFTNDSGGIERADLDEKKIFTVQDNKHWFKKKFALPNAREGSVVEYTYQLETPYYFENFKTWEFQSDIPKVSSEYMIHVPPFYNYKVTLRGGRSLTKKLAVEETDCFVMRGAKNSCSKLTYGMTDIPAFVEEDYMTSPKNYLSALYFELEDYTSPYNYLKKKVTKDWADIDQQLKQSEAFGSQLKKESLMKDRLKNVVSGKTDATEKAKAIYSYLQKWFKWDDFIGIYSNDGIREALDSHKGSIADINLALIAGLNSAGISAEAVLLSTRDHGNINTLYPGLGDFNYVVAKANIGDKSYLLDASDPLLGFGMLPLKCLNDKGRAVSLNKPSYWVDLTTTKQREDDTYAFDLTLRDDGKIKGTIIHYSLGYKSYLKRKEIKKFNSVDEYVENLDERLPKLKILKSEISNLDSLDLGVTEKYEVEMDAYDNMNRDKLGFNPYFFSRISVNPFKLNERDYPVDWGMPSNERYTLTMHLPSQYTVDSAPKNASIGLPNNGGKFITNFEGEGSEFIFSNVTQFSKSIYESNEYLALKELYNKIILAEKGEIIFKKKS